MIVAYHHAWPHILSEIDASSIFFWSSWSLYSWNSALIPGKRIMSQKGSMSFLSFISQCGKTILIMQFQLLVCLPTYYYQNNNSKKVASLKKGVHLYYLVRDDWWSMTFQYKLRKTGLVYHQCFTIRENFFCTEDRVRKNSLRLSQLPRQNLCWESDRTPTLFQGWTTVSKPEVRNISKWESIISEWKKQGACKWTTSTNYTGSLGARGESHLDQKGDLHSLE